MKMKKIMFKISEIANGSGTENLDKFINDKNNAAGTRLNKDFKAIVDLCKSGKKKVSEIRAKRAEKKKQENKNDKSKKSSKKKSDKKSSKKKKK